MHNARTSFEAEMIVKNIAPDYTGGIKSTQKAYGKSGTYCVFGKPKGTCVFVAILKSGNYFWIGEQSYYKLSESLNPKELQKRLS